MTTHDNTRQSGYGTLRYWMMDCYAYRVMDKGAEMVRATISAAFMVNATTEVSIKSCNFAA